MATMRCSMTILTVLPCGSLDVVSKPHGTRMQVFMRSTTATSTRFSLLQALATQAASQSQRSLRNLVSEVAKYVRPRSNDARTLEEALMTVPDLETIPFTLVRREQDYEIRAVESYVVAETTMPGRSGFDFTGSGQAFNTLAAYLFGKNTRQTEMAMTTPVVTQRSEPEGERMDMTTPVIQQASEEGQWKMSFVLPSKYSEDTPLPKDPSVKIKKVPAKKVAVAVFSGYVNDGEVKKREQMLRRALLRDPVVRVKLGAQPEVSQFNPPFTPPFMRRNEIALEIEYVVG